MHNINLKSSALRLPSSSILLIAMMALLVGCALHDGQATPPSSEPEQQHSAPDSNTNNGALSPVFDSIYTSEKHLSLTFNGMADQATMSELLDELDIHQIKATFFLSGMRVAEEPDIALEILARGHDIESYMLNAIDIDTLNYDQIINEIQLSNHIFSEQTGVEPRYVRGKTGIYNDDLRKATAALGMDAVISYTISSLDKDMKTYETIEPYMHHVTRRGAIIQIETIANPHLIPSIPIIAKAVQDIGYSFIPLAELISMNTAQMPLEHIPGYDAARVNLDYETVDYETVDYELVYQVSNDDKLISLTIDDWASDTTITKTLDILAEHNVLATFFLIGRGVDANPNLAKAILDAGHEVANHSYDHRPVTTMTPKEIQEDIVKAHRALTYAIQQQPTMLYRPPTGAIDDVSAQAIAAAGYPIIAMYDVTTYDWDVEQSASDILDIIMEETVPGSIILLHILDGIHTNDALPDVITSLKNDGYTFVTMSQLLEHHDVKKEG